MFSAVRLISQGDRRLYAEGSRREIVEAASMKNVHFRDVASLHEIMREHDLQYEEEQHADGRTLHKWTNDSVNILTLRNPFEDDGDAGNLAVEASSEELLKKVFVKLAYCNDDVEYDERNVYKRAYL